MGEGAGLGQRGLVEEEPSTTGLKGAYDYRGGLFLEKGREGDN